MKKKWIDISYELKNKTGVGAYILTLLKISPTLYPIKCYINIKKRKALFQILWQNTTLLFNIFFKKPEIIIFPNFRTPFFRIKSTKYITVIHDLAFYRKYEISFYTWLIYHISMLNCIRNVDKIITVSNTVRQELIEKFNISPDRIKVVYNFLGEHFINANLNPEILNKYNIQKDKYILSVATLNKRKNIPELIKAFESISDKYPELKLVLVGGMGNENREKLTKHPNIIFTGYIKDEEIPVLYKNALIYVFPSLYEGFGTPIIEAQYSNCPLLCSDIPVFREVAGKGAEFCKTDYQSIAEKMEYLINNPTRRNELINFGDNNVKRFSIENVAKQLLGILES